MFQQQELAFRVDSASLPSFADPGHSNLQRFVFSPDVHVSRDADSLTGTSRYDGEANRVIQTAMPCDVFLQCSHRLLPRDHSDEVIEDIRRCVLGEFSRMLWPDRLQPRKRTFEHDWLDPRGLASGHFK